MKRFVQTALVLFLLWSVLPGASTATHVAEPTAPITGLSIKQGPYPGLNANPLPCDGTATYSADKIRIEPEVAFTARPSEHWNVRVVVEKPDSTPRGHHVDWDAFPINHQNAAPHGVGLSMEVGQFNQYDLLSRPGTWLVTARVEGLESGRVYNAECPFTVVP